MCSEGGDNIALKLTCLLEIFSCWSPLLPVLHDSFHILLRHSPFRILIGLPRLCFCFFKSLFFRLVSSVLYIWLYRINCPLSILLFTVSRLTSVSVLHFLVFPSSFLLLSPQHSIVQFSFQSHCSFFNSRFQCFIFSSLFSLEVHVSGFYVGKGFSHSIEMCCLDSLAISSFLKNESLMLLNILHAATALYVSVSILTFKERASVQTFHLQLSWVVSAFPTTMSSDFFRLF